MKATKNFLWVIIALLFINCNPEIKGPPAGEYMGMKSTDTPQLLLPKLIASPLTEYNGTFPPNGKEFFYTTNIPGQGIITYLKMNEKGEWTNPVVASFSGEYSEYDPIFSPDGNRLYFTSERPVSDGQHPGKTNIWFVERTEDGWGEPMLLELGKEGVYYSSFTNEGTMYFNIWETGDLYKAVKGENGFEIIALDSFLNSQSAEGDPFISPDEDYIIFRGYNNSLGNGDLYISFLIDGQWTDPENLGEPINSTAHEMCPFVTIDGKFFIFASGRVLQKPKILSGMEISRVIDQYKPYNSGNLNIYYVSTGFIPELKKKYQK